MSRISKKEVHTAIDRAAKNIVDAAGGNKTTSRAELKTAAAKLPDAERALTEQLFRFLDHRDASSGARVTKHDVERGVAYTKERLVDAYDVNNNGLSKPEVAKMSKLGQFAVALARELKRAGNEGGIATASELGKAIEKATTRADGSALEYMSEGDYPLVFASAAHPGGAITGELALTTFQAHLEDGIFADEDDITKSLTSKTYSAAQTRAFLNDLAEPSDRNDPDSVSTANSFGGLRDLLYANLSDLRVLKVGPKEDDGSLAVDQGLYAYLVIGKTKDNQLAGVSFGSVET